MTAIKICGIRDDDAFDACVKAQVDYIGLVFFPPSPRAVSGDEARRLVQRPHGSSEIVALTVDAGDRELDDLVEAVRPDRLQMHGAETPERARAVRERYGLPVIKAFAIGGADDLAQLADFADAADLALLDSRPPPASDRPGGHGAPFDWSVLEQLDRSFAYVLSGGLTADNVGDAIRRLAPYAVDVSSGVERAKGVKDVRLIARFVSAARAAARGGPNDTAT